MSRFIAGLALCLLTLISAACDKVPLTAPTGSSISLTMNTTTLPLNGTAQIIANVLESGGTQPQDGTVVTFTTQLGTIDPVEARTHNGRATATFHAGNRSGTTTVRAVSGDAEAEVEEVRIGGAGAEAIELRIESTSGNGTSIVIVATVVDDSGNPIPGTSVSFSADRGQITPGVAQTDANGDARATLVTSETTTVTARVGGTTDTLQIQGPGALTLAFAQGQTPPFEVGRPVSFTVTPSANTFFSNVAVDFGDGARTDLGAVSGARTFSHTYTGRGTYTVTVTAMTATGTTASDQLTFLVNNLAPVVVALTATPATSSLTPSLANPNPGLIALTAAPTLPTGAAVEDIDWSFGDGTPGVSGTQSSVSHRYTKTGTFVVSVTIRTTDGRTGSGETIVTITP